MAPVITAGGSLTPRGSGTVKLKVHCSSQKYSTLTLKKVLFIPEFSVNIVSGALQYLSGGSLRGLTLFNSEDKALATLNFQQLGFYLSLKETPQTPNQSANSHAIKRSRPLLQALQRTHTPLSSSNSETVIAIGDKLVDLKAINSKAQLNSPYLNRLSSDASPKAEPSRLLKSAML